MLWIFAASVILAFAFSKSARNIIYFLVLLAITVVVVEFINIKTDSSLSSSYISLEDLHFVENKENQKYLDIAGVMKNTTLDHVVDKQILKIGGASCDSELTIGGCDSILDNTYELSARIPPKGEKTFRVKTNILKSQGLDINLNGSVFKVSGKRATIGELKAGEMAAKKQSEIQKVENIWNINKKEQLNIHKKLITLPNISYEPSFENFYYKIENSSLSTVEEAFEYQAFELLTYPAYLSRKGVLPNGSYVTLVSVSPEGNSNTWTVILVISNWFNTFQELKLEQVLVVYDPIFKN